MTTFRMIYKPYEDNLGIIINPRTNTQKFYGLGKVKTTDFRVEGNPSEVWAECKTYGPSRHIQVFTSKEEAINHIYEHYVEYIEFAIDEIREEPHSFGFPKDPVAEAISIGVKDVLNRDEKEIKARIESGEELEVMNLGPPLVDGIGDVDYAPTIDFKLIKIVLPQH